MTDSTIKLGMWTHPSTGEVRLYINGYFNAAGKVWLTKGTNGRGANVNINGVIDRKQAELDFLTVIADRLGLPVDYTFEQCIALAK